MFDKIKCAKAKNISRIILQVCFSAVSVSIIIKKLALDSKNFERVAVYCFV